MRREHRANRDIVYSSPCVPPEWIAAHGLRPCRLIPGRATAESPIPATADICPFLRAFVNEACHRRNTAGVVLVTVCDQMRRAPDLLRQLWCDKWHAEVQRLREALAGVPLLDLDLDGNGVTPRYRTRLQAFLEGLR